MKMSSKAKKSKAGKSLAGKSAASSGPEQIIPVTPVPETADPSILPFPEWSDQDVNAEKWDLPKSKDKGKAKVDPKKSSPATPPPTASVNAEEPTKFTDPHQFHLPASIINATDWKRPVEVYPDATLVVYVKSPNYSNLVSASRHVVHSELVRHFISSVGILEYLGDVHPSPMEFETPIFFPNTSNEPWRPWHHIYSMCKAGKNQNHNPQVNQLGKYVVRLFWMGAWRKIFVDDLLPVDVTNHVLLPSLHIPKAETVPPPEPILGPTLTTQTETATPSTSKSSKKGKKGSSSGKGSKGSKGSKGKKGGKTDKPIEIVIELWPFLLSKAIMKLASLTWYDDREIVDFNIINCLSGWIVQKVHTIGMSFLDVWEMCAAYSDHFAWPPDKNQKLPGSASTKGSKKSKEKKKKGSSKGSQKSKGSKKVPNFLDEPGIPPFHLVASCTDMRTIDDDNEVPDVSPCWSHPFLIDQTRDIPIVRPEPLPELARWKRFRWVAWAIAKGLWPEEDKTPPIKCFKMVSSFRKCAGHMVYKIPSKEATDIAKSVAIIEDIALQLSKKNKKGKDKKDKKSSKGSSSKASKKSSKSSKSSKKKGKKGDKVTAPPDPSVWGDFNKLWGYIENLYICLKPSQFSTKYKITDVKQGVAESGAKGKSDKGKKGKSAGKAAEENLTKIVPFQHLLLPSRNEPIYIFMDSLDYKFVVVNLIQTGKVDVLQAVEIPEIISQQSSSHENSLSIPPEDTRPFSHLIIENYDWKTNKIGETAVFLNTFGANAMLINFKEGRYVLRLWIKSDTCYVANILSDVPLVVGNLEVVLEYMTLESERLTQMCFNVSSAYGRLVQKFGMAEFSEGLKTFFNSYKPETKLTKLQNSIIHDTFMQEFLKTIQENFTEVEYKECIFALKVLFLNPDLRIGERVLAEEEEIVENRAEELESPDTSEISSDDDEIAPIKKEERASVKIQAFFKKIFVRKLKAMHDLGHKNYMKIFENQKKIYTLILSVQKRLQTCPYLLRSFFSHPSMSSLKDSYSVIADIESVISLQHFSGSTIVQSYVWLPVSRYVFHCNSPDEIIVKICLFCNLSKFMVRVFDNDTKLEIQRYTNNVNVYSYQNNAFGYTVLAYGWSDNCMTIPWKLSFATLKRTAQNLLIIPESLIYNDVLTENYRPNVKNQICKCLVTIKQDTLATFRLSAGFDDAMLSLRCMDELGVILSEISGRENVILPAVMLEFAGIPEEEEMIVEEVTQKRRSSSKLRIRSGSLVRRGSSAAGMKKREKSAERVSKTSSLGLKRFSSQVDKINKVVKYKDTVYVLEGFVVDDSWPLTKGEWDVVEMNKTRSLLGDESEIEKSTKRSSTVTFNLSKKSLKTKSFESAILQVKDQPFWRLQTVTNKGDPIIVSRDTRREEEIKNIKRKWYEADPDRYKRSQELRENYLETHYMKQESPIASVTSAELSAEFQEQSECSFGFMSGKQDNHSEPAFNYFNSDLEKIMEYINEEKGGEENEEEISLLKVEVRSNKRPVSPDKILPPLDLQQYMIEEEKEVWDKKVPTAEEHEGFDQAREEAIEAFAVYQIQFIDDMNKLLEDQIGKNHLLNFWYNECREESEDMMKDAYALREKFIDMIIEAEKAKQPPNDKDKKGKKGKGKSGKCSSKSSKSSKKK